MTRSLPLLLLLLTVPALAAAPSPGDGGIYVPPAPPTAPTGFSVREVPPPPPSGKTLFPSLDGSKPAYVEALWTNPQNAVRARLYSSSGWNGPWTLVSTMTVAAGSLSRATVPTAKDKTTCWMAEAEDGSGVRTRGLAQCWATRDGLNRPLWRAQLTVGIASVSDAGTDSDISAGINSRSPAYGPWGSNYMWLDTPADDFETGSVRTFELRTQYVSDVSDVNMIILDNTGDDQMCVSSVALKLDEQTAFSRSYSPCVWVRRNAPLFIDHDELRASAQWRALPATIAKPTTMSYDRLDSYVTMMVAQQLVGTDTDFNEGEPYGATRVDFRTRSYSYDVWSGIIPATVTFKLKTSEYCNASGRSIGVVRATDANASADGASWLVPLLPLIIKYGNDASIDSTTEVDLGVPCIGGVPAAQLCMKQDGVGANLGTCQ